MARKKPAQEPLAHVRATIHLGRHPLGYLPALKRGDEAIADPEDPWVNALLANGWLIPVGDIDELREGEQ